MAWTLINAVTTPDPRRDDGATIHEETTAMHVKGVGVIVRTIREYRSRAGAVSEATESSAMVPRAILHGGIIRG